MSLSKINILFYSINEWHFSQIPNKNIVIKFFFFVFFAKNDNCLI